MGYIIVIIAILALLFSGSLMHLPITSWFDKAQSSVTGALVPKTEREIIIENLQKKTAVIKTALEKQSAAIKKTAEAPDITEINTALEAVRESETLIEAFKDTQPTLGGTVVQKIISSLSDGIVGNNTPSPSPSIPPQCRVVCPE